MTTIKKRGYELTHTEFLRHLCGNLLTSGLIISTCVCVLALVAFLKREVRYVHGFEVYANLGAALDSVTEATVTKGLQSVVTDPHFQVNFFANLVKSTSSISASDAGQIISAETKSYIETFRPVDPRAKDSVEVRRHGNLFNIIPGPSQGMFVVQIKLDRHLKDVSLAPLFIKTANEYIENLNRFRRSAFSMRIESLYRDEARVFQKITDSRSDEIERSKAEQISVIEESERLAISLVQKLSKLGLRNQFEMNEAILHSGKMGQYTASSYADVLFDERIRWIVRAQALLRDHNKISESEEATIRAALAKLETRMSFIRTGMRMDQAWENSLIRRIDDTVKSKVNSESDFILPMLLDSDSAENRNSKFIEEVFTLSWKAFALYGFILGLIISIVRVLLKPTANDMTIDA